MIRVIGIDPGLKGGWALISDGQLAECGRLPVIDNATVPTLLSDLSRFNPEAEVAIEVQMVMPRQGLSSALKTGRGWGQLEGFFTGRGHRVVPVRSQDWKPTFKLTRKPKEASRAKALEMWPHFQHSFRYKRDEGVAEACLIAHHHYKEIT